jgi:tetratricopeptide (TPR) repeat protein
MKTSNASARQAAHNQMKSLMGEGSLDEALRLSRQALAQFGPHVGFLCDQAACEYELGFFQSCSDTCFEIQKNLIEAITLLSKSSKLKTFLFLAKLLEEQGEVKAALSHLREASTLTETENELKMIQSQEIRILSFLGLRSELTKKYQRLTEKLDPQYNLQIEVLHGLLWAEWCLFGYQHSTNRWRELKSYRLNLMDMRLMARDFLEICLLDPSSDAILAKDAHDLLSTGPVLPYDQFLLSLHQTKTVSLELPIGLSFMMKLRVLILQMRHSQNLRHQLEIRKKFYFLTENLESDSAEWFRKILPPLVESNKIVIKLNPSQKSLQSHENFMDLTLLQTKLFQLFSESQNCSMEQVVKSIWDEEWGEHHYHRIRMLIYKTNKMLQAHHGIAPFEVGKSGVSLNLKIQIQINS